MPHANHAPVEAPREFTEPFNTAEVDVTELADTLVRDYGLPFRMAHNIIGRAVQKGSLSPETLEASAKELDVGISLAGKGLTQDQIDKALDVAHSVEVRRATGGPAPFATKIAIADRKKLLDTDSAFIDERLAKISKAKEDLISDARRLAA